MMEKLQWEEPKASWSLDIYTIHQLKDGCWCTTHVLHVCSLELLSMEWYSFFSPQSMEFPCWNTQRLFFWMILDPVKLIMNNNTRGDSQLLCPPLHTPPLTRMTSPSVPGPLDPAFLCKLHLIYNSSVQTPNSASLCSQESFCVLIFYSVSLPVP